MKNIKSKMGPIAESIHRKLTQALQPKILEIYDDSYKHRGHAAMKGLQPEETHFRLVVVSEEFAGKPLIKRHRMVNDLLKEELNAGLHALQMTTKTFQEFDK